MEEEVMEGSAMEKLQEERKRLPIYAMRYQLIRAIDDNQILIVVGDPGSGKTTQIPQYLREAGYTYRGRVICTQPHRVAAMSAADRVSKEMGVKLGDKVGYSIPQVRDNVTYPMASEDCISSSTVLRYMTDDMLLCQFARPTTLADYIVVMIDEAHERTHSTDILFGLLKRLSKSRPDLKLIISSSAASEAEKFSNFFNQAPIFRIPERRFPVDLHYISHPVDDYSYESVVRILQIHETLPPGDILVFFTEIEEIRKVQKYLEKMKRELIICPLHDKLTTQLQAQVFEATPKGARKVVLATDIAETSLTIDGIKYVIDNGLCKLKTGIESLQVTPISRASANRRAAIPGRTGPGGQCFRLYTSYSYSHDREDTTTLEIMRIGVEYLVVKMLRLAIDDPLNFRLLMDRPPGF